MATINSITGTFNVMINLLLAIPNGTYGGMKYLVIPKPRRII